MKYNKDYIPIEWLKEWYRKEKENAGFSGRSYVWQLGQTLEMIVAEWNEWLEENKDEI